MRRNMDLLRAILLKLEEIERPYGICGLNAFDPDFAFEDATPDEVNAHMSMLYDAEFISSGTDVRGPLNGDWYFKSLTWEGRDFIDSTRDNKIWVQTKEKAGKVGGWTVSLLTEIAKSVLKGELRKLGVPIG